MNTIEEPENIEARPTNWKIPLRNTAYIVAALLIFLFALDLMISSLEHLGKNAAETIILATSNPFTGLFIGLLVTAIIQSSSAVTSIIIALVASGAITIEGAIPLVMGANVGTTITSAIVSLGFITKKKEFRRAVASGTYHSFFNILTVIVLFPAEYYYGLLSKASLYLATTFFNEPIGPLKTDFSFLGSGIRPLINFLIHSIDNGIVLILLSVALIFGSIVFFRQVLLKVLGIGSQERFQKFFFRSQIKSFFWGTLITAAIRSSTITTSLVVPLVAKKVVKMKAAVPFILGANVGTTITAFIAAMFNSNAAISIAIAHFLFNIIGVLIFFPIPYLKQIPINLALGLGKLTLQYRMAGFLYLLLTFFLIPFSLIFLNKNEVIIRELTYSSYQNEKELSSYKILSKTYTKEKIVTARQGEPFDDSVVPKIITISRAGRKLVFRDQLYQFKAPGFCWDGEDQQGRYSMCVTDLQDHFKLKMLPEFDSVYVFEKRYQHVLNDSSFTRYYVSAPKNVLLKKDQILKGGELKNSLQLTNLSKR